MIPGPLEVAAEMATIFDRLHIRYVIGGSVASSLIAEPRSTVDIDIAVVMTQSDLEALISEVRPSFYIPETAAHEAVRDHGTFNLIHQKAAFKVDVFVLGSGVLDVNQMGRRVLVNIRREPPTLLWVTSPEDQVLRKLDWFHEGGSVSDRQWRDVVGIIRINDDSLDDEYLAATATMVGLDNLLRLAQAQARNEK